MLGELRVEAEDVRHRETDRRRHAGNSPIQEGVEGEVGAGLTQEVYLRLARQPDVGTIRSARAFVFATATNLLRDRFRRKLTRGHEQNVEAEAAEIPSESADPQTEVECTQQLNLAMLAIRSLKPATRRCGPCATRVAASTSNRQAWREDGARLGSLVPAG